MNTESTTLTVAQTAARRIDEITRTAGAAFLSPESFEKELSVAQAVSDMRALLTAEVMAPIMALMNTSLGFDTDRNPTKTPKDNDGSPMTPYPMEVVREVFIESRLRGFHVVGNEFNIIAMKFYGGINGFERKVRTHERVTDFRDTYGVPVSHGDKGAVVRASACWMQRTESGQLVQQTLERDFAVRVNSKMGADAVVGKAKRKLMAAVYSRLTGVVTPEGEAGDEVSDVTLPKKAAATSEQLFGARSAVNPGAAKVEAAAPGGGQAASPISLHPPTAGAETSESPSALPRSDTPKVSSPSTPATAHPEAAPAASSLATELEQLMVSSGVKFEDFRSAVQTMNLARDTDAWGSYADVPEKVCAWFKNNPKKTAELVRKFGKLQGK